jgi:hypothetical protein
MSSISSPAEVTSRDALPGWPSGGNSRLECRFVMGLSCHTQSTCRYSDKACGAISFFLATRRGSPPSRRRPRTPASCRSASRFARALSAPPRLPPVELRAWLRRRRSRRDRCRSDSYWHRRKRRVPCIAPPARIASRTSASRARRRRTPRRREWQGIPEPRGSRFP